MDPSIIIRNTGGIINPRCRAKIFYRSEISLIDTEHDLLEIYELHDIVERGPHWDTIAKIEIIRVNHCESDVLTIEGAKAL